MHPVVVVDVVVEVVVDVVVEVVVDVVVEVVVVSVKDLADENKYDLEIIDSYLLW